MLRMRTGYGPPGPAGGEAAGGQGGRREAGQGETVFYAGRRAARGAARRARLLRQTRAISLGIAGGAALASIGLGTTLARAADTTSPGQVRAAPAAHAPAAPGSPAPGTGAPGPAGPGGSQRGAPEHSLAPGRAPRPAAASGRAGNGTAGHGQGPTAVPAPAVAPPVSHVASGGS
jgi:hypothetical protein